MKRQKAKTGRKPKLAGERAIQVAFYTTEAKVTTVGGMEAAREIAIAAMNKATQPDKTEKQ